MSSGIYTTPGGRDRFYNCAAGVHVWRDRTLFKNRIRECVKCGALDDCGLGPQLMHELLFLEAKKQAAKTK